MCPGVGRVKKRLRWLIGGWFWCLSVRCSIFLTGHYFTYFPLTGALREWNKKLEKSPEMQREFRRVNARHSAIRRGLVEPEHLAPYLEKMGEEAVEQILASGIAGISPEKTEDLKCLHAHLAD